jgi:hypothetical protein
MGPALFVQGTVSAVLPDGSQAQFVSQLTKLFCFNYDNPSHE